MKRQLVVGVLMAAIVPSVAAQQYTVRNLGTLNRDTRANALNNVGDAVGYSYLYSWDTHAFLTTKSDAIQDLGTLEDGRFSAAGGINDRGEVVGYAQGPDGLETGYVWTKASGMRDLGERGGSGALAINQNGDIAGYARSQATMWTADGNVVGLGRIGGIGSSYARAINSFRQVVGQSGSQSVDHAFLWTAGQGMQDLGTFGGLRSLGMGINDDGQVVGTADLDSGESHAFLWTEGQGMLDLGTLGEASSRANGINHKSHVVGTSSVESDGGGFGRAFVWTSGRGITDLNSLIASSPHWTLVQGTAINENGQIIATAFRGTSTRSLGVLLTPVMTTSLVSSQNVVKVGKPVTFTATVEHLIQGPAPEGEIVTFKDGWRVLAQIPLTGGTATFTTSQLNARTHSIRAYYSGDATYRSSKSTILQQVIEP